MNNMASSILKVRNFIQQLEARLLTCLLGVQHHPLPALVGVGDFDALDREHDDERSLKDEGFLFAVPKSRRTIAKRRNRRFGWPELHWKPLVPKTNLVVCGTCGHYHQSGFLCDNLINAIRGSLSEYRRMEPANLSSIVASVVECWNMGTCFKKVMKETEEIQKSIDATYKLEPIDKEVIVLYEEEALAKQSEFANGKRIVEMKKKRPSWFSSNLRQKSTVKEASTKDVLPTELA